MGCPYVAAVAFPSYKVKSDANVGVMTDTASAGVDVVTVAGIGISFAVGTLTAAAVRLVGSVQAQLEYCMVRLFFFLGQMTHRSVAAFDRLIGTFQYCP